MDDKGLTLAIVLSIVSLVLSACALAWNIYRDVALRPRLRVTVARVHVGQRDDLVKRFMVSVVNFGPGKIRVEMVWFKHRRFLSRLRGGRSQGVLIPHYSLPGVTRLPGSLEVGDAASFYLKWTDDLVLRSAPTHLGYRDSFGRFHWASRKDTRQVIADWRADFPAAGGDD